MPESVAPAIQIALRGCTKPPYAPPLWCVYHTAQNTSTLGVYKPVLWTSTWVNLGLLYPQAGGGGNNIGPLCTEPVLWARPMEAYGQHRSTSMYLNLGLGASTWALCTETCPVGKAYASIRPAPLATSHVTTTCGLVRRRTAGQYI